MTVTEDIDHTDDPIVAAGVVVDAGIEELHPAAAETVTRLGADRILADADCLFHGEATGRTVGYALGTASGKSTGARTGIGEAAPRNVKGVAFGSALGIFDADHGGTAVARIADQVLPAAAIDALKAEIARVARQGTAALEAAPLRGIARDIPEYSEIAADFDLGDSIYYHFDGALAAVTATTDDGGTAFELLLRG